MLFRQVFKTRKAKKFNYAPLYYDKKKEERDKKSRSIKIKRHQYFDDLKDPDGKSVLSGKIQSNRYSGKSKMIRYGLILGLMAVVVGFVKYNLRWEYAIVLTLVLLIAFIREVNKL